MSLVGDKLLEREDGLADRMFKRLTPKEREAYKILSKELSNAFRQADSHNSNLRNRGSIWPSLFHARGGSNSILLNARTSSSRGLLPTLQGRNTLMEFLKKLLAKVEAPFKKVLAKVQEYVKLAPWLQYALLQIALIPGVPEKVSLPAMLVSLAAYLVRRKSENKAYDGRLRNLLSSVGYPLMAAGKSFNVPVVEFVGGALVMTEFVYELIYP